MPLMPSLSPMGAIARCSPAAELRQQVARGRISYVDLSLRPWQIVCGVVAEHDLHHSSIQDVWSYAIEAAEALGE